MLFFWLFSHIFFWTLSSSFLCSDLPSAFSQGLAMQWRAVVHCLYLMYISQGGPFRVSTAGETPAPAKSTSANMPSPDAKTDSEATWVFFLSYLPHQQAGWLMGTVPVTAVCLTWAASFCLLNPSLRFPFRFFFYR